MAEFLQFIGGAVVLCTFLGALLMLYHRHMYRMYKRMARELADEMFRAYVRGCEYRIHTQQRITIIDETGEAHTPRKIMQTHHPRVYDGRSARA